MTISRCCWPFILLAAFVACSGNLGGGQSTLPGTLPGTNSVQQAAPPVATPTPTAASNVATVGDSVAPQALPAVMGWGGTIAFAKPVASPVPVNAKAAAAPSDSAAALTSIGITASVVNPADAPRFSAAEAKHRAKHDPGALTALFFISLLATSDVSMAEYPSIAVDVPRDIAAKHRDDTYALALYDPERKEKTYRLAVAERDYSNTATSSAPVMATPVPTPIPVATSFAMPNGPGAFTPPPIGAGLGTMTLPPEHIAFKTASSALTLKANRPAVFALYAVPPEPSPSPSASATASTPPGTPTAVQAGSTPAASATSPAAATPAAPVSGPVPAPSSSPR